MTTKKIHRESRSSEYSSVAAEVIANNVDLLSEILVCVPAWSLIRFQCVSKHWLSVISDPQFGINYCHRNPSTLISGLYLNHPFRASSKEHPMFVTFNGHRRHPTLDFLKDVGKIYPVRVKHACNGLMLCAHGNCYIVCNLTTQKYIILPNICSGSSTFEFLGAFLAFDPSKSPNYKVVVLRRPGNIGFYEVNPYQVYIYTSKTASWKCISDTLPLHVDYSQHGVFWNGAFHWMGENVHIKLEVDEEKVTQTRMPPTPKLLHEYRTQYLGECGGSLLLVRIRRWSVKGFRILEMDRYICHWIVKYRVNLRPVISSFPMAGKKLVVLSIVKGGNENDLELILAIPRKVISYNLKSKKLKVLFDSPLDLHNTSSSDWKILRAYPAVESLSPVYACHRQELTQIL